MLGWPFALGRLMLMLFFPMLYEHSVLPAMGRAKSQRVTGAGHCQGQAGRGRRTDLPLGAGPENGTVVLRHLLSPGMKHL